MKKYTSMFVLALVLVLVALAGCLPSQAAAPEKKFNVGFAQDTLNQPWRNYQAECIKNEFAKLGIEIVVTDGQGSAEQQISNIEDMVVNGLDLLLVSPQQEGALTPVVQSVYEQGIPVVCVDRGIHSDAFTTYVHADNIAIGRMVADYVAERMTKKYGEAKGNIVVLEGVAGATTTLQRDEGFRKQIAEKYPNLKIMASQPADFRRDTAMSIMEDFLQAYDDIDVVFTHADESTMGAIAAIENAGRRDEMIITSVNGTMEGIKAIIDGRLDCSVLYTNASGPAVDFAMKILNGETAPKDVTITPVMINTENAAEFYTDGIYSPDPMPLVEGEYIVK